MTHPGLCRSRDFDESHVPRGAVVSAPAIRVYSAQVIAQGRP